MLTWLPKRATYPTSADFPMSGCGDDLMAATHSYAHACRGARDSSRGWWGNNNLLLLLLLEQGQLKLLLLDLNLLLGDFNLLFGDLDLLLLGDLDLLVLLLGCMQARQPLALLRARAGRYDSLTYTHVDASNNSILA